MEAILIVAAIVVVLTFFVIVPYVLFLEEDWDGK